jgi:coenzyme Q-binding protein COQ10
MAVTQFETTFDAPIDTVFKVLTRYETYPEFVDGSDAVEVLGRSGNSVDVKFSINVIKEFTYTLTMHEQAPNEIKWNFKEGDLFKQNNGYWLLTDLGNGKTKAKYQLDLAFKLMVPKMILNKLINSNLPKMMEQYHARILEEHKND